jgi:hypothetical protein
VVDLTREAFSYRFPTLQRSRYGTRTGDRGAYDVPPGHSPSVQRARPHSEVVLAPEEGLDGQVEDFAPHVLVRSDSHSLIPEEKLGSLVSRVEVRYTDTMDARVSVAGGGSYTIEDATMEDLLALVDEAEELVSG